MEHDKTCPIWTLCGLLSYLRYAELASLSDQALKFSEAMPKHLQELILQGLLFCMQAEPILGNTV